MTKRKQMAISRIYKENWYCNSILSANKNWNASVNSRTGKFNRSTLKRKNCGESQEDPNVPSKRILRSTHVTECYQVINNCERNASASLPGIHKSNKKLSAIKTSNVSINDKAILKHDVQSRTCRSNRRCNLYDNNGINRKQNTKFQQENLFAYEANLWQKKSSKPKSHKSSVNRSNATGIPSLIDSKSYWERDYATSIQTRRKGNCETNKRVTTKESNKFHLQIKEEKRKDIDRAAGKYKECDKKSKKKYIFHSYHHSPIVTTARSSEIDTKIKKNIATRGSCTDNLTKRLIIPLIRTDDLPLSELSKLIQPSKSVRVKRNVQENKEVYFETKNITETQCSTYKQYRSTTNLKRDKEINILYKSVFQRRQYTEFKDNGKKEIDANIKLERNTRETLALEDKAKTTLRETLRGNSGCESESRNLLENIILQLFLKNRRNTTNMKTRQKSDIETRMKKSVAMCGKCAEVFDLLRQFSGKINFIQNEKLCVECTLCNVQINSLFHFQRHVMDIHLQCKRKSLAGKKKFPVVVIDFSEQTNVVDRSSRLIFECCCCSRIFDRRIDFEKHVKNTHTSTSDIEEECKSKQTAKSSELYATFKNEQVLDESCALNEHCVFDISTNVDGISNQITKENLEIIENVRRLNIDEEYANDISKIAITSKSELTNVPNYIEIKQTFKAYQRHKRYSFVCNICFKRCKRKYTFLSHMSKHVREQRKTQENNNPITFDDDLVLNSNVIKTSQGYIDSFEDDNASNPIVNLTEFNGNALTSKTMDKNEVNSFENANTEYVAKEDGTSNKIDDCSYLLRINLTQKTEEGTKRQKLIKFDINVAKKCKTSSSEQQSIENEIENKRQKSFTTNGSFATDTNKKKDESGVKKRQCNVCDKKFSSLTILKEHMFILHDSLFEDPELSNLPMMPRFNDNRKVQNLSAQDIYTFEEKPDPSCETRISKKIAKNGDERDKEEAVYQTFNTDKRNRKWRCNACKENFALLRNYLRHKYYCHNDESVVHICDNCNKILTSVAMVNIHTCANVTSWICKRCNLNFSSGVRLTRHNMNCHLEKVGPHICKICKFSFLTAYMLTKHEATHSPSDKVIQ